jgi:hypothetical protein
MYRTWFWLAAPLAVVVGVAALFARSAAITTGAGPPTKETKTTMNASPELADELLICLWQR